MKKVFTLLTIVLSVNAFGQTLKTFNGPFNDGRLQNGNATYTYYEDPNTHEYLKQGAFKYTFKGQGDYTGFDQTITGSFEKGLKNGTWTYVITMTDFGKGNPYATGTVTLTANYKNGYADGNWKEVRSYKNRKKYLVYGQYKWEPYEALKTMTINMNFKDGYLVGAVNINDEFAKFKATGSYDNNSLCIGTWIINDMGWGKNRELIYKDNILYEFIARGNNGEVLEGTTKYQTDYDNLIKVKAMNEKEREEAGMSLDTVCGGDLCAATNNIKEYFPKLFSVDYFLYEFIGGDLSFKEGFKGGCNLQVSTTNFTALSSNQDFIKAEEFYSKNDLLRAYELYSKIDVTKVKPSERKKVTDKIALLKPMIGDLIELYHSNSKFFQEYTKQQYDSLEQDKLYFSNKIALKTTKDDYGWVSTIDENGISKRVNSRGGYMNNTEYKVEKPWENYNWETAKSCFESNKGVYTPIQTSVTEQFFKFNTILENEEKNIKKTGYNFYFENTNNSFYTYDKNTFLNNIASGKKEYNLAKSLIDLQSKCNEKKNQIEALNSQNKKKTLFSKYQLVYKDFNTLLQSNSDLQSLADNLGKLNTFLDKVIGLYSQDTKELEKQLKDAETADQIKALIN